VNGFERIAVCAAISIVAHGASGMILELLPPLEAARVHRTIEVKIVEPPKVVVVAEPPKQEPVPEPVPEPVKPPDPVKPVPVVKPLPAAKPAQTPKPTASPDPTPQQPVAVLKATDNDDGPVFSVDMSSMSNGGGVGMQVGHGGRGGGGGGGGGGSAAPVQTGVKKGTGDAPIGAAEATKMPLPQGRCFGKYTPEATAAGTEGVVTLDLTVDEKGHARDIVATTTLANGLTASAIAALRDCTFSPGEKDGAPTAVRIRGFKVRFALQESQP
jgi:TonB family protein